MLRTLNIALLACLAPLHAQELAPESAPETAPAHAWTGELRPTGGQDVVRPADAPSSIESVAERLADVQLALEVERDFEGALADLRELWVQVARLEPFPGQEEALVRVALQRSELLERLGRLEAARAAVAELLPPGSVRTPSGDWLTRPAGEPLRRAVAELRSDARIAARLAALEERAQAPGASLAARPHFSSPRVRAYVEEHFGLPSVEMDQLVLEQMKFGLGNVQNIGMRAAPTLAALVLSDFELDDPSSSTQDPLDFLFSVDRLGASILVADHLEAGGGVWRLRIFDHVNDLARALEGRSEWDAILATLFRDPHWSPRVRSWIERRYASGGLHEALVEALAEQAADPASTPRSEVYELLTGQEDPRSSARPVYVAALSHPDGSLRRVGAQHLLNLEETATELRRFAGSADPEERGWALDTLLDAGDSLDASERQLLLEFLDDPEPSVRRRAVSILGRQEQPFPAEVYLEVAGDEDPQVLRALARAPIDDRETQTAVLLRLADSGSPDVLAAIDRRLMRVHPGDEDLLPVLEKRFVDPTHPFPTGDTGGFELEDHLAAWIATNAAGRRACVRMGLASGREEPLNAALAASYGTYSNSSRKYPRCAALLELEPARLAAFFEWAHGVDLDVAAVLAEGFADLDGTPVEPFVGLARDPGTSRMARIHATGVVVAHDPEAGQALVQELLHEASWTTSPPSARESRALRDLAQAMPDLPGLVTRTLDDPQLVDPVALAVVSGVRGHAPLTNEVALRILDRWLRPDVDAKVVEASLEQLETMDPEDVDPALVIRAAYLPEYAEAALRAMGTLRHPEYLPVLERALLGRQYLSPGEVDLGDVRWAAVDSLTCYLSDQAARILVEGLSQAVEGRSQSEKGLADRIRQSLATIRDYHEERSYWDRQGEPLPTREGAVAQLLAMLADSADWKRVEAIRGLASFGALEAIPRLIPLLEDPSEAVAGAARQALDHLYRLSETRGG